MTVEEAFLLLTVSDLLGGGERVLVSPAQADVPDDGWLVSTDRYPNRQGLRALGFRAGTGPQSACDGILFARCEDLPDDPSWAARLEELPVTVAVAERVTSAVTYADHVVAVASHFEAEGSFINRQGRLQQFAAAVKPPGEAVAGWRALADLVAALGGPRYESRPAVLDAAIARMEASRAQDQASASRPLAALR